MAFSKEQIESNKKYIGFLMQFIAEYYSGFELYDMIDYFAESEEGIKEFNRRAGEIASWINSQKLTEEDLVRKARNAAERNEEPQKTVPPEEKQRTTAFDIFRTQIDKAYEDLKDTLSIFSNDSPEFKAYYADLEKLYGYLNKSGSKITYEDGPELAELAQKLKESSEKYYAVRIEKNKVKSNTRSRNRVRITESLRSITAAMLSPYDGIENAVNQHVKERSRARGLEKNSRRYSRDTENSLDKDTVENEFTELNSRVEASDSKTDSRGKDITKNQNAEKMQSMGYNGRTDARRIESKVMLQEFVNLYREPAKGDPKLSAIIEKIDKYSKQNVTAVKGNKVFNAERKLYRSIQKDLTEYFEKQQEKILKLNTKTGISSEQEAAEEKYLSMASGMLHYFEGQSLGDLAIEDEKARHIRVKGSGIKISKTQHEYDRRQEVLFPHEPSPDDIVQGSQLGNCYFVSALSAIAQQNPQAIKDAMRDNNDGTVTVRFFARKPTEGFMPGTNDIVEPIYVTVDKLSTLGNASNCLWVEIFERAFAGSGLNVSTKGFARIDHYARPVPENIDELYEKYSKMKPAERPGHIECPWLIDKKGNLHKWTPSFHDIAGGQTGYVLESILGDNYHSETINLEEKNEGYGIVKDALIETFIQIYPEGTKAINKQLRDKLMLSMKDGTLRGEELLYVIFSGGRMPEYDEKGRMLQNGYNTDALCAMNVMQCFRNMLNSQLFGASLTDAKGFFDSINRSENVAIREIQEMRSNMPYSEEGMEKLSRVFSNISDIAKQRSKVSEYDGQYSFEQLELFDRISRELSEGSSVTAGTPNKDGTDKRANKGLNYKHAYSVTGTEDRTVNGKTLHFVKIRNPHGVQVTRQYGTDPATNKFGPIVTEKVEGAESLVELNDFFKDMDTICFASRVSEKPAPVETGEQLSHRTISEYDKALTEFLTVLKGKKDLNVKYDSLITSLETAQNILSYNYASEISCIGRIFAPVAAAASQYLEIDQTLTGSSHVNTVNALLQLTDIAAVNEPDPRKMLKYQLAKNIVDGLTDAGLNSRDPEEKAMAHKLQSDREGAIAQMQENPVFKNKFAGNSTVNLAKMAATKENELADAFKAEAAKEAGRQKNGKAAQKEKSRPVNNVQTKGLGK